MRLIPIGSGIIWAESRWTNFLKITEDCRICNTAVRSYAASARVYLSLEHHWNIRHPGGDERQHLPAANPRLFRAISP